MLLINLKRKICKMISVKRILISVLLAYLLQVVITLLFIFPITSKNNSEQVSQISIEKSDTRNRDEFKPPCNLTNDAKSALSRAKTQYCKERIANISCLIKNNNFYPESLPHSCPTKGMQYGRYLGCYADKHKARILPDYMKVYKDNSKKKCLDKCFFEGFPFAGLQYSKECFCGNEKPSSTFKLAEEACNMTCSGAPDQICGGSLAVNVFETGIPKFFHKNLTVPSNTTSGESVRIVFILTLNGRALRQLHRFINAIYRSRHYYYIHVDARQDYLHRKLSVLETMFPNIKVAKERFTTMWGGPTYTTMMIESMRILVALDLEWDFVINLSESDFPLKSIENLEKFLSVNKGNNFIRSHERGNGTKIPNPGMYKSFLECEEHMWLLGDRSLPSGMINDGGSDWLVLSKDFVSYIVGPKDEFLTGLEKVYNHTIFSSESYFHTVLRNTQFCNTKVDNHLRLVNWNRTQGCKCQYKHIVDWCGCSPMDFRLKHWKNIENTKKKHIYFGRKFEPVICHEILNKVEQLIGFQDLHFVNNLNAYWESIFNTEDNISSKDDLFISHAESISRIADVVKNGSCKLDPGEVIEINVLFKENAYEGNLVLHKASSEGKDVIIETLYKPKEFLKFNHSNVLNKRVKVFKVSSQYDQKEQVFKNFADILGPFTEPVLVYDISPNVENKTDNFTIYWADPTGHIANINEIHVNNTNHTNFINSNLSMPILPGLWTAALYQNSTLIVHTRFLITPLEYSSRKRLSLENKSETNGGSQSKYQNFSKSVIFPKEDIVKNIQEKDWVDKLSRQYYDVIKSCISHTHDIKEPMRCGGNVIDVCELTDWSSLSPDPKGTIGKLNENTGKLERIQVFDTSL